MSHFMTLEALVSRWRNDGMVGKRRVERIIVVTVVSIVCLDETTEQHLIDIPFRMLCIDEVPEEI